MRHKPPAEPNELNEPNEPDELKELKELNELNGPNELHLRPRTADHRPQTVSRQPNRLKGLDRPAASGMLALTQRDVFTGWVRGDTMFT
jgi:hypothetical protein